MPKNIIKTSIFLSLVLRHAPEKINLELDECGWGALVDELLESANSRGKNITRNLLEEVVRTNDKKRFIFSDDGLKVRANQGHSIDIQLGLEAIQPPDILYHGTATRFLDSIKENGLLKGSRQHVHLSSNNDTAIQVGTRHGKPVVLSINAGQMFQDGFKFYLSENSVWLTDHVSVNYIAF